MTGSGLVRPAHTVRAYAFDLLAFARWLDSGQLPLAAVTTDVLLRFLAFCRSALPPGQPGGNVIPLRSGRGTGYAPATVNRRLAAVSCLFSFWAMRDRPRRARCREARPPGAAAAERSGLLAHLARPKARSGLQVREPRRLPRGLDRAETTALLASFRTAATPRNRAVAPPLRVGREQLSRPVDGSRTDPAVIGV